MLLNPHKLLSQDYPWDTGAGKHSKSSASWGQPSAPLACSHLESGFPWESTCCSARNSRTASECGLCSNSPIACECGLCSSLWQLRQQQHLWERKLYPSMKLLKNNSIVHVTLVVISIVQVMQEVECTCKGR